MRLKPCLFILILLQLQGLKAQNALYLPPLLTGKTFNLEVRQGQQMFYAGLNTPTYGVNGPWMAPTIQVNKGDSIVLNVINKLPLRTTMHWHGLHVAAEHDGGPHQIINPGTTWSPSFKIRNNAATFWYHPHGASQTDPQVSRGLAGFFIVKDEDEAKLNLPRSYGIDDFPLCIQSKAFDELQQIAIATDMDTALFVNGTLNPILNVPAQVVRFRLLNGSSLRSYYFGFSNNQEFYQIGSDGGLLDSSLATKRLLLSPGERAEVLIDFGAGIGQNIYLKSYASEMKPGIYGSDSVGNAENEIHDYDDNFLNGLDFDLLQLKVVTATANPVTSIPKTLLKVTPFKPDAFTKNRRIVFDTLRLLPADKPNLAEGPFGLNQKSFDMEYVNDTVLLNDVEIWTLVNKTMIAHPFHIHDIQFNVLEKSGTKPAKNESGWKDVVLVMPNDSVKFITKFETFADEMVPYMYHCHLLHHEDDGMMGSFIVIDTSSSAKVHKTSMSIKLSVHPNPGPMHWNVTGHAQSAFKVSLTNSFGQNMNQDITKINSGDFDFQIQNAHLPKGIYFLKLYSEKEVISVKLLKF